jgi:dihydrodipicolinate synthase/N-acetylneuraminate lyase
MINTDRLTAKTLKGNWATLLLPINSDDSIDYSRLESELDHFIKAVVDGIYSNGTAGEFHNQTEIEFDRIQNSMAEKCHKAGMLFQIGASHPSPIISLERVKRTVQLKPSAFQVVLPDWVSAGPDEQLVFLKKIEEAANGIPLVLYNPPHAKSVLEPVQWSFIKEQVPGLIGMKLASGDKQWFEEMRQHASDLSVFVPGHLLATGVKEGVASGAYSNIACISPAGSQKWWRLIMTDFAAALEIQERILQFFDECIVPYKKAGFSNPALDKFLAAVGAWSDIGTRLRWPYKWIPLTEVPSATRRAKELIPEFF